MTTLILFAAAAPFRAAVQLGDGSRMLVRGLDQGADDSILYPTIFVDELGVEIGVRARFLHRTGAPGTMWNASAADISTASVIDPGGLSRSGRDMFALIIRRAIMAAERNLGLQIGRLLLVVPSGLSETDQSTLLAAGHIAGCAIVELVGVGDLLVAGQGGGEGQRHLLVHLDIDQMRISLFRAGATGVSAEMNRDLSENWSGDALISRLTSQVDPCGENSPKVREFIANALPQWESASLGYALIETGLGPPQAVCLPLSARRQLVDEIMQQVTALLTLASILPKQLDFIHLHGAWATGLRVAFSKLAPQAHIKTASSSFATLELAVPAPLPRPTLSCTFFADRPSGARISTGENARVLLLRPGIPLPALFFDESFPTQHYFEAVGLVAHIAQEGGRTAQLISIPLPRLFEQRPFSRLQLRVIADTDRHIVALADLAIESNTYMIVYDKRTMTADFVDPGIVTRMFRQGSFERTNRNIA